MIKNKKVEQAGGGIGGRGVHLSPQILRNTLSDTEVGVPGDTEWTGVPDHQKKEYIEPGKTR